jgi:hypothetical protein
LGPGSRPHPSDTPVRVASHYTGTAPQRGTRRSLYPDVRWRSGFPTHPRTAPDTRPSCFRFPTLSVTAYTTCGASCQVRVSCCVAGATVSQSLRVVQVALCSAFAVQVSRCSPLGNRSPDHRHPGSLTRCAALLSSTLQAFARLCKCRCLVRPACLAACGASRCGDRQNSAPLAQLCQTRRSDALSEGLRARFPPVPGPLGAMFQGRGGSAREGS